MTMSILEALFGLGGIVAIIGLFFPKLFWEFVYLGAKEFTKKDTVKARIYAIVFIIFIILLYILDRIY